MYFILNIMTPTELTINVLMTPTESTINVLIIL